MLKAAKDEETKWGNLIIRNSGGTNQWTTVLCQELVREVLVRSGKINVRRAERKLSSVRSKRYEPDLECDDNVYEVKGRGWCTPGTAGEKILGVPLKYGEVPRLYKKPLKIVLVGYQEFEAKECFAFGDLLDSKNQTQELGLTLDYFKKQNIEYVAFTDLLRKLGLTHKPSQD